MEGAKVKFRMEIDPYLVGVDFMKVYRFDTLPHMLLPLTLDELKDFYKEFAKKLGMEAVKE